MSIDRVRYFSVVAETGHLRKAAELLGMTPGSLSKAIHALEEELGIELVRPSGRGIEITEAGQSFYRRSGSVLSGYADLLDSARKPVQAEAPPVKIGSFEVFTTYFLTRLLHSEFPGERVVVRERVPGEIERSLMLKEIDLGITYAPYPSAEIEHVRVGGFVSKVFVSKAMLQHPFKDLPFAIPVTPVSSSVSAFRSLDGWPPSTPRRVQYQFELLETAIQCVRAGRAAIYCPAFVIDMHNEAMPEALKLHEYPAPSGMGSQKSLIYLARRRGDEESQAFKRVARFIRRMR